MSTFEAFTARRLTAERPAPCAVAAHALASDRHAQTPDRPNAIPWGALGMIALIVVFECFLARNWLDFTDPVSLSWRFSADAVRRESPGCELLCLGDSLIKHGLIPSMIEDQTDLRTANLAAARAPALLTYFLLRRVVDAGGQPKAVIINVKPAVLMAGPEFNARYWQEILTPRECIDLARMDSGGPVVLSTIVGRLLPSLRARLEVRSNVLAALRGEPDRIGAINRVLWRNWSVNRGANVNGFQKSRTDEPETEIERRLHPGVFYVDRTNAAGLEWLMQLADERKIPVFWLLTPLSANLQARRDQSGSEAKYEQFVRSFQVRYPRVLTVLDARRGAYPGSFFTDQTHLNSQGAIALSRAVASAIRPLLAASKSQNTPLWVALALPAGRKGLSGPAPEDLEQSREILNLSKSSLASSR
jgi:hypothetical protein